MTKAPDWTGAIARAQDHAPFLAMGLERQPELAGLLAAGNWEAALDCTRTAGDSAESVGSALRRERLAIALALAIGDLAGAVPLATVMTELSAFADRALDAAIADAIRKRMPEADPQGFVALALGKHGAGELNYSSDIDPILLYDPVRLPHREREEAAEAAQRVARSVVETLSHVDAEGYVFRVDLRLRPASEVSPLAISFDAALTHYESSALAWERAAFIRARSAAGDVAAGKEFLAAIRPFVWRKSLDFGAIAEIGRLTARIRAHHRGRDVPGPGFELKRGRGGIREVEFFAQTHQLIHGGRRPALRLRGTRPALDALAVEGIITPEDARALGEAYDRLRLFEHRLQMVADQQTHALPSDPAALENVAALHGLSSAQALVDEITAVTEVVAGRFDALLEQTAEFARAPAVAPAVALGGALSKEFDGFEFAKPAELSDRIAKWSDGRVRALRSEAARAAFEAILPALLKALSSAPDPERAFVRWETFLIGLPSAVNLFRLLEARPALLEQLLRVLTLAPPLADELTRRSDLLDALIDASALDLPGPVDALRARMAMSEREGDYQSLLDGVRRSVGDLRFALGVQLIDAAHDPLEIASALSRTAEVALGVLADAAQEEFAKAHGVVPGVDLVVLGLGRLGGGVLTHASDLDLIYLFTGEASGESDGARPLGPTLYFNRLAQRVTAALSVPTAEGALYEVDTRLRPQGAQGPLAVSLSSFARYQREDAWTWEHMALTRARPLYGPEAGRVELAGIIADVLRRPRDAAKLKEDVLTMRAEMAEHKPRKGPLDAKLARGGLVDLEFMIHYLQLRDHVGLTPDLGAAAAELAGAGLLPDTLVPAQEFMTRLLVASRLLAPDGAMPAPAACQVLARACGCTDESALLREFADARQSVAAAWTGLFGEKLEIDDE